MAFVTGTPIYIQGFGNLSIEQVGIATTPPLPHLVATPLGPRPAGPSTPVGVERVWKHDFSVGPSITCTLDQEYLSRDEGWNWVIDIEPEDLLQRRTDPADQFLKQTYGLSRSDISDGVWIKEVRSAGLQLVWEVSTTPPKMYYAGGLLVRG